MHKKVTLPQLRKKLRENGEVEFGMYDKNHTHRLNSNVYPVSMIEVTAKEATHLEKDYLNEIYAEFAGKYSKDAFAFAIWVEE